MPLSTETFKDLQGMGTWDHGVESRLYSTLNYFLMYRTAGFRMKPELLYFEYKCQARMTPYLVYMSQQPPPAQHLHKVQTDK